MSALRVGSLCTGYGGLDQAVHEVFGGAPVWVADNDPGAAAILAHHHPGLPNLGDITAVDWAHVMDRFGPVDLVCAGYPCQPFSTAGKRKGTDDVRHIWPHIAAALGVLRPRYAVFENVAGHLRLGFDTVLADLACLGFDAEWLVVPASAVGAAHQRKRLFLLAHHPDRVEPAGVADAAGAGRQGPRLPRRATGGGGAAADPAGVTEREPADPPLAVAGSRHARPVPGRGGLRPAADPAGVGHRDTGPQGVAGLPAAPVAGGTSAAAHPKSVGRGQGRSEPARQQRGSGAAVGGAPDWGPYAPAIARWEAASGRSAPGPVDPLGRLNPAFVEWLMGLPAGHVTAVPGLSRTAQLKALGNGVVPQQAAHALRTLTQRTGVARWFGEGTAHGASGAAA